MIYKEGKQANKRNMVRIQNISLGSYPEIGSSLQRIVFFEEGR